MFLFVLIAIPAGKSINLTLSQRGLQQLKAVGVDALVLEHAVPLYGRMIHKAGSEEKPQVMPYSSDGDCIYSINRNVLNILLLDRVAQDPNITVYFHCKVEKLHFRKQGSMNTVTFSNSSSSSPPSTHSADYSFVFGCDGVHSVVREEMKKHGGITFTKDCIEHGYKELAIGNAGHGSYHLDHNSLHIWPRGNMVLLAMPNKDQTFTASLFMPDTMFKCLETEEQISQFLVREFPGVSSWDPKHFVESYLKNPKSSLRTVKCSPHHLTEGALLIGDAAHAIVPFYGQGVNCGFEDCLVFADLLTKNSGDFAAAAATYSSIRKADTDAIADLSMQNYMELRCLVNQPQFHWKRRVEGHLQHWFPNQFTSVYKMVAFSNQPYHKALKQKLWQDMTVAKVANYFLLGAVLLVLIVLAMVLLSCFLLFT